MRRNRAMPRIRFYAALSIEPPRASYCSGNAQMFQSRALQARNNSCAKPDLTALLLDHHGNGRNRPTSRYQWRVLGRGATGIIRVISKPRST